MHPFCIPKVLASDLAADFLYDNSDSFMHRHVSWLYVELQESHPALGPTMLPLFSLYRAIFPFLPVVSLFSFLPPQLLRVL